MSDWTIMDEYLSASAQRAVDSAIRWAALCGAGQVNPDHLLLGVAEQEESQAASILARFAVTLPKLKLACGIAAKDDSGIVPPVESVPLSPAVRDVLNRSRSRSIERAANVPAGTDMLLLELLAISDLRKRLAAVGLDVASMLQDLEHSLALDSRPLAADFANLEVTTIPSTIEAAPSLLAEVANPDPSHDDDVETYRILDAAANRAREGLRVIEDFVRFARDDPFLTAQVKSLRHELRQRLQQLPRHELLAARDTQHDVGTSLSTAAEWVREDLLEVVSANFKRTQEALRTLEEFGKVAYRPLAETVEQLRYRAYTLERAILLCDESRARLDGVVLYVLITPDRCSRGVEWTVHDALTGGAQMIQLRAKGMEDRPLTGLARQFRRWTNEHDALFIVNDRPDIARLSGADGVHVGQTELSVKEARCIVGPKALVGVSTHSIEQARQAVIDGANYIGVGPTFPSTTKGFDSFPGLDLLARVHAEIRLPAFAIGGIGLDQIDLVVATGARRIAVGAAVSEAASPRSAAAELRRRLAR